MKHRYAVSPLLSSDCCEMWPTGRALQRGALAGNSKGARCYVCHCTQPLVPEAHGKASNAVTATRPKASVTPRCSCQLLSVVGKLNRHKLSTIHGNIQARHDDQKMY